MSRRCGILDISQPYEPPQPDPGIAYVATFFRIGDMYLILTLVELFYFEGGNIYNHLPDWCHIPEDSNLVQMSVYPSSRY
jgi:hypothetical protein